MTGGDDSRDQRRISGSHHDRQVSKEQHVSGGQLYIALTSSAETSWHRYKIKDPLHFKKGDNLISRCYSKTYGLHKGYVRGRRRHHDDEGWFHPDQVRRVDDPTSAISPGEKRKAVFRSSELPSLDNSHSNSFRGDDDDDHDDGAKQDEMHRVKRTKTIQANSISQRWVPPAVQKEVEMEKAERMKKDPSIFLSKGGNNFAAPIAADNSEPLVSPSAGVVGKGSCDADVAAAAARERRPGSWDSKPGEHTNLSTESCSLKATKTFQQATPNPKSSTAVEVTAVRSQSLDESATEYVQVPDNMAAKARFPPGCRVMRATRDSIPITGFVRSVHLQLRTPYLVSGESKFDVLYRVETEGCFMDSSLDIVPPIPEEEIQYAGECKVFVKSSLVPGPIRDGSTCTPSGEGNECWVAGIVASGYKFPGDTKESYVVTLENGCTVNAVPRDSIRYQDSTAVVLAGGKSSSKGLGRTTPSDFATSKTTGVSAATPKQNTKRQAPELVPPIPLSSTPATATPSSDDASKASSDMDTKESWSLPSCPEANTIRRINIPDSIDFEKVKSKCFM